MENSQPFFYPDYIVETLKRLMECSSNPRFKLLYDNANIVSILFNTVNNYPLTEQVYDLLWIWLNKLEMSGCHKALKEYWRLATQHYTFKLQYSSSNVKDRFLEFHVMVGTMLYYKKNYEILNYIFTFSNSLPQKFYLIPSTFSSIFQIYKNLSEKNKRMYLLRYHMDGIYDGAGEENKIEGLLINYLALLLVRLNKVNDYNITYSNPMSLPSTGSTIEKNTDIIREIQFFKDKINDLRKEENNIILKSLDFTSNDCIKANEILNNYKAECESKIQDIESHPHISEGKKDYIKDIMISTSKLNAKKFPLRQKKDKKGETFIACQQLQLDSQLILSGHDMISSNIGDAIVNSLYIQLNQFYCYQFLLNSAVKSYTIPYRNMGEAIKRLRLNDEFVILALGISPHFFDETEGFTIDDKTIKFGNIEVENIVSNQNSLIFMKKELLPYAFATQLSDKDSGNLKMIDTDTYLYSNIDNLSIDDLILTSKIGYEIVLPHPLKYIRIKIGYNLAEDDMSTNEVEAISHFIV